MSPPVMISISLLLLAGWGWTVYSWISDVTSDYSYVLKTITTLWRVLGVAKEIGASLIFILFVSWPLSLCFPFMQRRGWLVHRYGLYFYFACVATHRSRRKNRTRGRPSSSPQSPSSEHDIEEEMESDQVQECRPTSTSFIGTSILSTGTSLRCTSLTSDRESSKMHPETTSIEVPTVPPPSYRSRGSSRRRLGLESNHSNDDALWHFYIWNLMNSNQEKDHTLLTCKIRIRR